MIRTNSFSTLMWQGEQGPTIIMDQNLDAHKADEKKKRKTNRMRQYETFKSQEGHQRLVFGRVNHYGSWNRNISSSSLDRKLFKIHKRSSDDTNTIRFQVIVWSIDTPNMTLSRVSMKFRVTLFWNIVKKKNYSVDGDGDGDGNGNGIDDDNDDDDNDDKSYYSRNGNDGENETMSVNTSASDLTNLTGGYWVMQGRSRAKFQPLLKKPVASPIQESDVDVPPLSIINAESFTSVGPPDITKLRETYDETTNETSQLMRWTCLYRANLLQNDMKVEHFPHDKHTLTIQLGILQNRHSGGIWDRDKWKLSLANEDDSHGSTRVPYGLVVDTVKIPEFNVDTRKDVDFQFSPLPFGGVGGQTDDSTSKKFRSLERCLEVKIKVTQESGYYDMNIIPVFMVIAVVSILVVACLDADQFFQRGLMLLNW